jgi:hypothetical protein
VSAVCCQCLAGDAELVQFEVVQAQLLTFRGTLSFAATAQTAEQQQQSPSHVENSITTTTVTTDSVQQRPAH